MKKIFTSIFIIIPLLVSCLIFALPDKATSENENRSLKTLHGISASDFQNDFEAYLSDQLPLREKIVSAKSAASYALGKRDINGGYICKDRLIQKITEADIDIRACERYADKINALAEKTDTVVMYVPSAGIELDCLPKNARMYDFNSLYDNLSSRLTNARLVDLRGALSFDDAYYLTDHHWTAKGAYSAYEQWCAANSTAPQKFELENVTNDFRGTLYSKVLLDKFPCDSISAPVIKEDITVVADGVEINLYDKEALKTKDKYNFFEGGNHGILTIENKNARSFGTLLVLKDSFANSFVPYLINDYQKIIMLDERYTFISPSDIIESERVTQILVLKEIIS